MLSQTVAEVINDIRQCTATLGADTHNINGRVPLSAEHIHRIQYSLQRIDDNVNRLQDALSTYITNIKYCE